MKLYFAIAIILTLLLFIQPIDSDGDFFQHLNIGKFIVENHALPRNDDLTFTANGRPYTAYAWAWGVGYFLLFRSFGPIGVNALTFLTALTTFFLLFLLLKLIATQKKVFLFATSATMLLVAPLIATRWPTRPEIVQFPLIILILLIDRVSEKKPRLVLIFPIIILAWANLYGSSVLLGLGIILASAIFKTGANRINLSIAISLSFVASFLNGYGSDSVFFIRLIPQMTKIWGDWSGFLEILAGPNFFGFPKTILIVYFSYLLIFGFLLFKNLSLTRKNLFYFLLSFSILVPLFAARHRGLAALLSAPFLFILIEATLTESKKMWTPIIFSGIAISLLHLWASPPKLGLNENDFPQKLVKFIEREKLTGKVFNTQRIGSFLSYNLNPKIKVYSDTRDDLFVGTTVLTSLEKTLSNNLNPDFLLRKNGIDLVIVSKFDGQSFNYLLTNSRWKRIYNEGNYSIFKRI